MYIHENWNQSVLLNSSKRAVITDVLNYPLKRYETYTLRKSATLCVVLKAVSDVSYVYSIILLKLCHINASIIQN